MEVFLRSPFWHCGMFSKLRQFFHFVPFLANISHFQPFTIFRFKKIHVFHFQQVFPIFSHVQQFFKNHYQPLSINLSHFWVILSHFGPFWPILPIMAILTHLKKKTNGAFWGHVGYIIFCHFLTHSLTIPSNSPKIRKIGLQSIPKTFPKKSKIQKRLPQIQKRLPKTQKSGKYHLDQFKLSDPSPKCDHSHSKNLPKKFKIPHPKKNGKYPSDLFSSAFLFQEPFQTI